MKPTEQKLWSYLCSQLFQHFWGTTFLSGLTGYRELWHSVSSWYRQKMKGSFPRLLYGSSVLSAPGGFLLRQEFEQWWKSFPCSQMCQCLSETGSLPAGCGYRVPCHQVSFMRWRKPARDFSSSYIWSDDQGEVYPFHFPRGGKQTSCRHKTRSFL